VIRFLDYFFVLRPILFLPGWTTAMAGYLAASDIAFPNWSPAWQADIGMLRLCAAFAMLMGAAFIINQLEDSKSDAINGKLFFISENMISRRAAFIESWVLLLASWLIASSISWPMLILFLAATPIFTFLYNHRPFAWKNHVYGSLMANSLMGVFAFAFGWLLVDHDVVNFARSLLPYVLFNTGLYFLTTIPDANGDARSEKRTVCVEYGLKFTIYCSAICALFALISAFVEGDRLILVPVLVTGPFFILMVIRPSVENAVRTLKLGVTFFSICISLFFPTYLCIIILLFVFTRWFYRKRFDMIYPHFKGA